MKLQKCLFWALFLLNLSGFAQSTASPNVNTFEIAAPQLDTLRKIWVYLPEGYQTSEKRYPVLYMHDAQNLFDAETSFAGEWQVDETLDSLKMPQVIVVGIEHGNEKRIEELTPYPNEKYGGGKAGAYVDFLVNTLKPHIDSTYRSLPEAENTGIMGSSLGGLTSFYAAVKHPEIFSRIGVFSPSFWYSDEIFELVKNSKLDKHQKFYFMAGTAEDEEMVTDLQKMLELLKEKEFPKENLKVKIVEGGKHNEASWSREFLQAFQWLFPQESSQMIFKINDDQK
ncbi:MAG: alpha/beta hydrolase-fold protein [Salinimicrobium sp.]